MYSYGINRNPAADPDTRNTTISSTGAMVAYSGLRYGRSPKDKRVILDANSEKDVWWGSVNMPLKPEVNRFCRDLVVKYLNTKEKVPFNFLLIKKRRLVVVEGTETFTGKIMIMIIM